MNPEAIVLDVTVFEGPDDMAYVLSGYQGICFAILPEGLPADDVQAVQSISCVKHAVTASQVNFAIFAGQLYDAVMNVRRMSIRAQGGNPAFAAFQSPQGRMFGYRAIAVWSPQGGVGKSTVSMALAMEAANRNLPTLLVGLGGPDPNPLIMRLRSEPNINIWRMNPTADGLKTTVQKFDTLDVLAGFPDPVSLQSYATDTPVDAAESLSGLVHSASLAGYAVVVIDVSAQELAPMALSAANTVVLVAAATIQGVLHTVEATRVINDVLAGRHSVGQSAIHLVVNRYRNSTYTPREVMQMGVNMRKDFPALITAIPDDPAIEEAVNARRPPYVHSIELQKAMNTLGDMLFAPMPTAAAARMEQVGKKPRVLKLGPIRLRL